MDKTKALQNLLHGKATKKEIELLKQALASGEISIGGDVNRSVVIIGSGNKVELTTEALSLLKPETKIEEPVAGEPPYMGLRYFDTQDVDLFYGRESLTREMLARVQKETFLAIVGASGSGKSSVARAGLVPAWKQGNERGAVHVITPTAHPLESLAASLTRESESVTATSTLMDDLKNDPRSLRLYVKKSFGETELFLLVDQFEETFTLCKDQAERKAFIENLLSLVDDNGATRVVITLRADFYHHCAEYEGLRNALKTHQEYIGAMTEEELRQAITTPAENNGWDFQPGLVDLILQDVGSEPGALPLLSHALLETWKRRQGHTLTLKGYADAGGVKKAIAQTAESVYDKLTPAEQTIARGIFLRLIELGEGLQGTRRRAKLDELARTVETQDTIAKVLKILTDARLVTTAQDSAEVSHEALIREWGTLRRWLEEDRESLRLHYHLTESAQEWERRGREASELYRGARLKRIHQWMKEHTGDLSPLEEEFVKASQNVKKREQIQWISAACAGVALLMLVILGVTGQLNRFIYQPVDMEDYWVIIPAGEFQMGSSDKQIAEALKRCPSCDFSDEQPQHLVNLDEFRIGKYEVTNRQYARCVKVGICPQVTDMGEGKDFHPVVNVNWYNAQTFCEWVGGRLPTEAEWEKAASWDEESQIKRIYPWGDTIGCSFANYLGKAEINFGEINEFIMCSGGGTMPVGSYKNGKSHYGAYDMAGNVWEWTNSLYQSYPYDATDGREEVSSSDYHVLRGGSIADLDYNVGSAVRYYELPTFTNENIGFRCARDVP
jgi:formylglycine-generating enzyme required for sulfatase activity